MAISIDYCNEDLVGYDPREGEFDHYLYLSLRHASLRAGETHPAYQSTRTLDQYHGRAIEFAIPAMRAETVNALLDEIAPLAEQLIELYEERWTGSNTVGGWADDDEAQDLLRQIEELCNAREGVSIWDAREWYAASERDIVADLGDRIVAATDDEIYELARELDEDSAAQASEDIEIAGTIRYLRELRARLQDERDECDE